MNSIDDIKDNIKKGTTTVGIVCKEGIVLSADKRASMGTLIANKDALKILEVTDKIAMTIAGGVGDAQMLRRYLRSEMRLYEIKNQIKPDVKATATILGHILFGKRMSFTPFYVQLLLAGHDDEGFHLYSLDMAGGISEEIYSSTGSGSVIAYGFLEHAFKKDLSINEGVKLGAKAINVAMERDMATGNGITLLTITKDGFNYLEKEDIEKALRE